MTDYRDVLAWRPADLSTKADSLDTAAEKLRNQADALERTASTLPDSWVGDAADAATAKLEADGGAARQVVKILDDDAAALRTGATQIENAQNLLSGVVKNAKDRGFTISADGTVTPPTVPPVRDSPQNITLAMAEHNAQVQKLNQEAQDVADDIARYLGEAVKADEALANALGSFVLPELLTTDVDGYLLPEMTEDEQRDWALAQSEIPPELAALIKPEVQEDLAKLVAADLANPDKIDEKTLRLLKAFAAESAFAHELYSEVSLDDLADAVEHVNEMAYHGQWPGDEQDQQFYRDFVNATGLALTTYTQGTGRYGPPSDLADRWFAEITDDDNHENAAALTLLVRAGGAQGPFDDDFLHDLTEQVYEWERSQTGRVWGPRATGILDPNAEVKTNYEEGHGSFSDPLVYTSGLATDGLANLLAGMGHSPGAAQQFFTTDDGEVDASKLDYLIGVKDGDDVSARTFSTVHLSDEGEGLGLALEAATIGDRSHEQIPGTQIYRDEAAAAVASDVFARVADLSGHGDGFGPDDTWHLWTSMPDHLGYIAAGYASDVYTTIIDDGTNGPDLDISIDELDVVVSEIGRGQDKNGIDALSAAIIIEGNARLAQAIDESRPSGPVALNEMSAYFSDAVTGRAKRTGQVLAHVLDHSILVDLDDEAKEAARKALASRAFDISTSFLPGASRILGEGASYFAKDAYDVVTGQSLGLLKDAIEAAPPMTGQDYIDSQKALLPDRLVYNTINTLIQAGVAGPNVPGAYVPPEILIGPEGAQVIRPDIIANGSDNIELSDEDIAAGLTEESIREAWYEWRDSRADLVLSGMGEDAVTAFFNELDQGGR